MKSESILVLAIVFFLAASAFAGTYSGGDGSVENPYRIATPNDLNDIGNHVEDFNKCFVMINDINLADYTGTEFNIIGYFEDWPSPNNIYFKGVFDGNGHTISNFTYESPDAYGAGLFRIISISDSNDLIPQIKNLTLIDPNVSTGTGDYVGALIGWLNMGIVKNCHVQGGSISGRDFIGGIVGYNRGRLSNCSVACSVSGNTSTGGLVGINELIPLPPPILTPLGIVENCYTNSTVDGNDSTGGLVGINRYVPISKCYATGSVNGNSYTGGLVGRSWGGYIYNCYALCNVSGIGGGIGGLVGVADTMGYGDPDTIILSCYATGLVTGVSEVGGLLGANLDGVISNTCFWDKTVNPTLEGIGNTTDPNVIGESTTNMKKESTFTDAGWDFIEIWNIGENQTYPYLRVYPAGDLNHDGRVDLYDFAIVASHWLEGTGP